MSFSPNHVASGRAANRTRPLFFADSLPLVLPRSTRLLSDSPTAQAACSSDVTSHARGRGPRSGCQQGWLPAGRSGLLAADGHRLATCSGGPFSVGV